MERSIPADTLLTNDAVRRTVAARLESVVATAPFSVPDGGPALEAVANGDLQPLVAAITAMPRSPGPWQQARFDLRMSLILWRLLNHARASARFTEREHPMARILMAAGLASWAKDLPQPCKATLHTPRHRRTPDQRAEVADWRKRRRAFERLALQWLQDGIDDEWVNRLDAKLTSQWRPESQLISPPLPREPLTGPIAPVSRG